MPSTSITLQELHEEYTQARRIDLNFEQFVTLATFFPALLIISTDGEVDDQEWFYIDNSADHLCNTFSKEGLSQQEVIDLRRLFQRELHYLQQNFDTWERKFTKALKFHMTQHPDCKTKVLDNMYQSASVSEGICEKEKVMIEYLLKELGVE